MITGTFLMEAIGQQEQAGGLVRAIEQRCGDGGIAVFSEEIKFFKQ